MISISRRQVDRLIARGELSAVKIGHRTTRVSVESIERLLREGRKRRSKGVSTRRTQRAAERSAEKRGEGQR